MRLNQSTKNSVKSFFSTNYFQASKRLVTSQSYYDSEEYEKVLQKIFGDTLLLESGIDSKGPRVACVSTLVNRARIKPYVWRNYNLVFGKNMEQIHFHGTINSEIWKAIRCSSAAPGYFGEVSINKSHDVSSPTRNTVDIHQDGGILVNNPSALALSECSALWPKHKVQCMVSIGTGRFEPNRSDRGQRKNTSLMEKVSFIIDSATNVANVHSLMFETMPEYTYFRFNPYLAEKIDLDAWRPQEIEAMERSSLQYCKLNENKLKHCSKKLEKLSDLQKMVRAYL